MIRRRRFVVLQAIVIVPILAFLFTLTQSKEYTATATLLFRAPPAALEESSTVVDPTREAATNGELVGLPVVADQAAENLHNGATGPEIYSHITATPSTNAETTQIAATDTSPEQAAEFANAYAQAYIDFRQKADRGQVQEAITLAEASLAELNEEQRAGDQGNNLERQLNQLKLRQALQTGGAELVQEAGVPSSPSSPHPTRNVMLGIVLGALLGIGLAILLERVDRRVRTAEELEELYGAPILSRIPASKRIAARGPEGFGNQTQEGEAFRVLRTNLRFFDIGQRSSRSILVISPEEGDGKSTVARGLAVTMAEMGDEVVLVEGDLRKGGEYRHISGGLVHGLSNVLAGQPLSRVVIKVQTPVPNLAEPRSMAILPSGPVPPNPSELLESARMAEVLAELEDNFDAVIFDSPAAAAVSDALAIVPLVAEVVVVGGLGRTTRDAAHALHKQFGLLRRQPVGVIVNFAEPDRAKYSHYYRPNSVDAPAPVD